MVHKPNPIEVLFFTCTIFLVIAFLLSGCSSAPTTKASIVELPVSCEACQQFNATLAPQPDTVSICVCE